MSSLLPTRSRPERTRRRVFFLAESLESRQLLSVGAVHPASIPIANIPAIIGPAIPSPVANVGTTASATPAAPQVPIVIEVGQITLNFGNGTSLTESVFLVEGFSSGGIGASSSGPISGPSSAGTAQAGSASAGASVGAGAASNASITPLTATILAGPSANKAPVIAIVTPPTLVNLTPSTIPVTTQAILLTATLEEQPLQPPVLGQGFESGQTQGLLTLPELFERGHWVPARTGVQEPTTDFVEPFEVPPVVPAPAVDPAQPVTPDALPRAARDAQPLESLVLDPIPLSDWSEAQALPVMAPRPEITAHEEYPTWSLATIVGTAAVASGGYQLVLGGSHRFNQRWLPLRRSSGGSRIRKSGLAR